eukprot:472963_1
MTLTVCASMQFRWSTTLNYVWVGPELVNWDDANDFCESAFDTTLASIHSSSENTEVTNLCSGYCQIGLVDFEYLAPSNGNFHWIDGSPVNWGPNWSTGEPNGGGIGGVHNCGTRIDPHGTYQDVAFDEVHALPFICNAPNRIHVWSENSSYIWVGPQKMNWFDADNYCMDNFGTRLASIHSESQNIEITELCPPSTGKLDCYIGFNNFNWSDESVVNYEHWKTGQANNECAITCNQCNDGWIRESCQNTATFICNAPVSCETSGDIVHFDWDNIHIPYYNATLNVNGDELSVDIDISLQYLGYSYAEHIYGFGTSYFISLNSFSSSTLDIFTDNGLNECDNRISATTGENDEFDRLWKYSEYPFLKDHIASIDYFAYPPSGFFWNLTLETDIIHKCDRARVNYGASFLWSDLQNQCKNPLTDESSVDILVDNDWINLTGTLYINIVSPLYKDIDSGIYRIYEVTNEQFTIAVSKSVHVLGSTGISLYKTSIISINTEEDKFKMDLLTEAADYLQLSTPTILVSPNAYQFNIEPYNDGVCLSYKSNICVQIWSITTMHNKTCNNFAGIYGVQWIAQCNDIVNSTRCLSFVGDTVALSVETEYEDKTCDAEIGKAQFDGQISFYRNDSFIENANEYLFVAGKDTIFVEVDLNVPSDGYSIFDTNLINVWLCTIDDQLYSPAFNVSQTNPSGTGCFSANIDNDGYNLFWIIQNHDELFEHEAMHINYTNNPNIVRFRFTAPYILSRDTLWIHTQIELSLINNNRKRVLLDAVTSFGQIRHFIGAANIIQSNDDISYSSDSSEIIIVSFVVGMVLIFFLIIYIKKRLKVKDHDNDSIQTKSHYQTTAQIEISELKYVD